MVSASLAPPGRCRHESESGGGRRSTGLEALATENWAPLSRTKRHGGLLTASGTRGLRFDFGVAVVLSGRRGSAEHGNALALARFAAFRFVLELLIVKEKLFPSREDEVRPTVDTLQHLVLKFHLRMAPFSPSPRAHSRGKNCGGTPKIQVVYYSPPLNNPWTRPVHARRWRG